MNPALGGGGVLVPVGLWTLMARCYYGNGPREWEARGAQPPSPVRLDGDQVDPMREEGSQGGGGAPRVIAGQSLPANPLPKGFLDLDPFQQIPGTAKLRGYAAERAAARQKQTHPVTAPDPTLTEEDLTDG